MPRMTFSMIMDQEIEARMAPVTDSEARVPITNETIREYCSRTADEMGWDDLFGLDMFDDIHAPDPDSSLFIENMQFPSPEYPIVKPTGLSVADIHNPTICRMYDETNETNITNLKLLIEHFYLHTDSHNHVIDCIDDPPIHSSWMLPFNKHHRIFIPVPLTVDTDRAYKYYIDVMYGNVCERPDIPWDVREELCSYEVWVSGMFEGQKLFKYLRKKWKMNTQLIQQITSKRNSGNGMWLVISKNPVDWLFMSTNQSFSSCLALNSDYSGATYFGIPDLMCDDSKVMVFLTTGKTRKFTIKEYEFKHFRYINRSIGVLTDDNSIGIVRYYPSHSIYYSKILKPIGINAYEPREGRWQWRSNPVHHFELSFEDGEICEPYHDHHVSYRGHGRTYTDEGAAGTRMSLNWIGGFERASSFEEVRRSIWCEWCEDYRAGERYEVGCDYICETCYEERTRSCYSCEMVFHRDDGYYVYSCDDVVCESCVGNTSHCDGCSERFWKNELTHVQNYTLCEHCIDETTFVCDECGDRCMNEEELYSDSGFCELCYEGLEADLDDLKDQRDVAVVDIEDMDNRKNATLNELNDINNRIQSLETRLGIN